MIITNDFNINADKSILNSGSGFSCTSVEMCFAELQNEMAKTSRDQAMEKINTIKQQQSVQKKISEFITELRNRTNGKKDDENVSDDGHAVTLPVLHAQINSFLNANGLSGISLTYNVADINKGIQSLQGIQETVGSDIQQQMLLIQELMGKVSSYTQGASSAVNKSGDVLTAILR